MASPAPGNVGHVETAEAAHEESRAPGGLDVGLIALVGVVGTILVYVTVLACTAAFYTIRERQIEQSQATLPLDRAAYMQQQDQLLHGTYWVDKERGVVSIPIDQAMEIVAKQGLQSP